MYTKNSTFKYHFIVSSLLLHSRHNFVKHICYLVVSGHELRQEVLRFRFLRLLPVAHEVAFLLPDVDGFLQLHLALDDQHVDYSHILDVLVLQEFFFNLLTALLFVLRDIEFVN